MNEQLKLRTAYKLLQSHNILSELSVSSDNDRMRIKTAQDMIFENAYAILDSIEPNIEQVIKGTPYSYVLKGSIEDESTRHGSSSSAVEIKNEQNKDDYCCESGGKGGAGDPLWDLMYGEPD